MTRDHSPLCFQMFMFVPIIHVTFFVCRMYLFKMLNTTTIVWNEELRHQFEFGVTLDYLFLMLEIISLSTSPKLWSFFCWQSAIHRAIKQKKTWAEYDIPIYHVASLQIDRVIGCICSLSRTYWTWLIRKL